MTGRQGQWNGPRRGTTTGMTLIRFDDQARLLSHVMQDPMSGCWLWTATVNAKGYGFFWQRPKMRAAHRASYELFVGPIPDGLHLDHLCRTPSCINPSHLEAVTPLENLRRGFSIPAKQGRQTHCRHGHPLSGSNLHIEPSGSRRCVTCRRETGRAYRARKASA